MMHSPSTAQPPISRRGFLGRSLLTTAALTSPRVCSLGAAEQAAATGKQPIDPSSLTFLKELAVATIEAARVQPGKSRGGAEPNRTDITLITPGGNYPALWTRDFAMSLDCGLIGAAEILPQLRLIARCQNGGKERVLPSGGIIPSLHLGVLSTEAAERARKTVTAAIRAPGNTVEYQGAVRHVPLDRYFKPNQCWESSLTGVNTYQSGAFWHTPTGWLIEALQATDPALAREVCERFIRHLREGDFRKGGGLGAPWECFGLDMAGAMNPVYMASVTLPLAVLQGITASLPQNPKGPKEN